MEIIVMLVVSGLFAWLCAEMAKTRKRDTTVWAILGFLFGIITVIVLALIGTADE